MKTEGALIVSLSWAGQGALQLLQIRPARRRTCNFREYQRRKNGGAGGDERGIHRSTWSRCQSRAESFPYRGRSIPATSRSTSAGTPPSHRERKCAPLVEEACGRVMKLV